MKNLIFSVLCFCAFICPSWMSASSTEFNNTPSELAEDDEMNCSFVIRARLAAGSSGGMELKIDDVTVKSWTLSSSSYQNFTYTGACGSNVKVEFLDYGSDLAINYIEVNGTRHEAESQAVNTGVWQGQCGGSYSERLDCSGHIDFGDVSGGNGGGGGGGGSSTNVAAGKSATATAQQSGNGASKLTDGNSSDNSRWSAKNFPQSATIDLGASFSIDEVKVHTYQGRAYRYRIQASCDNSNWTTVVDRSNNSTGGNPITDNFSAVDARYVRIRVTGASGYSGSWVSINELEVFGSSSTGCGSGGGGGGGGGGGQSAFNGVKDIPGKIQAEDYDNGGQGVAYNDSDSGNNGGVYRNNAVDIQGTNDNGGGFNVGWTSNGEWLEYTVDVSSSGNYDVKVRYAGPNTSTVEVTFSNGNKSTGNISLSASSGWQSWKTKTKSNVALNSGQQVMRLRFKGAGVNINHIEVLPSGSGGGGGGNGNGCMGNNPNIFSQNDLLKHGVNMSTMESYPYEGDWTNGVVLCENDFKRAADVGIRSFRIPIRWDNKTGGAPNYNINSGWFNRVDEVLGWAKQYGESVIINVHHFDDLTSNPNNANKQKFYKIWEQIAERYQCEPSKVFFELLNEPKDALNNHAILNEIHEEAISIVRQTNPHRSILVSCRWSGYIGGWDPALEYLPGGNPDPYVLPSDNDLILTGHTYDPQEFTHQGAWWITNPDGSLQYPVGSRNFDNAARNKINGDIGAGVAFATSINKPLHVGEFGALARDINCNQAAVPQQRVNYIKHVVDYCESNDLSWAHWEWKGNFGFYNEFSNTLDAAVAKAVVTGSSNSGGEYNSGGVNSGRVNTCNGNSPGDAPSGYCSGAGNSSNSNISLNATSIGATELTSYPNPFTTVTTIQFNLAEASEVSLQVMDLQGKVVRSIYNGTQLDKGFNQVEFEAKGLSTGMYFIHLQTQEGTQVRKLLLESKK